MKRGGQSIPDKGCGLVLRFLWGPSVLGLGRMSEEGGGWEGGRICYSHGSSQQIEPWRIATANTILDTYHGQGTLCV